MQLEAIKEQVKKAIKDGSYEQVEQLKSQIVDLEKDAEASKLVERRYKTNDATV